MADNLAVTPGTGASIAADDVGGALHQRVKPTWGGDGVGSDVTTTSPLPVQLRDSDGTAAAMSNLVSAVAAEDSASADGDKGIRVLGIRKATPANTSGTDGDYEFLQMANGLLWTASMGFAATCSTDIARPADTAVYTINDAWSDSTSAPTAGGFTFTSAARKSGGSGIITDAIFTTTNPAGTPLQGECWIFDTAITAVNDNAAFAISDTEVKTVVAKIPFTLVSETNNGAVHVQNLAIGFTTVGSANLRFLIKVKNAYTPASSEVLTCRLKVVYID